MDPLSVAAALLGLLDAAQKVTCLFGSIISATKEAPQVLQDALTEVKHVEISVRSLQRYLLSLESINPRRAALIQLDELIVTLTDTVLTFYDLEKLLEPLAAPKLLGALRNAAAWSRHAKDIDRYLVKLQRHKLSLTLMLSIIQSESDIDALQSQYTLHGSIQRFLNVHEGFSRRLIEMENSLDLKSTLSKHKLDRTSVVESEEDEGASDARTVIPLTAGRDWPVRRTAHNVTVLRFDFEDDLENSRVYRRCKKNDCSCSYATSAFHLHSWSIFSGLSLADISVISVISLPLNSEDIEKIKNWDLTISAHDIFARVEPNDPSGAPDNDMLSLSAEQSSLVQDAQKKQKAEKKSIFSRTSTQSAGSPRSERERWSIFSRSRGSMSSGTSSSLINGEIPYSHKGIDHIDYQESVKAISGDYEELGKRFPSHRGCVTTENVEARWCSKCRQRSDFFFWNTKEGIWICEFCYTCSVR